MKSGWLGCLGHIGVVGGQQGPASKAPVVGRAAGGSPQLVSRRGV